MPEYNNQNFDVGIIGAGLSGLTSAAILSKTGLSVCVIELNNQPGGYLAKYEKNGFTFDTAIHWLNNCGPDGIVNTVFDSIGSDYPKAKPQRKIKRFLGENFDYTLTNNPDELRDQLIKDFPEDKKGIIRFFAASKKMGFQFRNFNKLFRTADTMNIFEKYKYYLNKLRFVIPFIKYVRFTGEKGKEKGLNKFFKTSIFHDLFSNEPDILSCMIPIAWAYNKDYQNPPEGGSQTYAKWLAREAEALGCKIIFKAKAKKITQENGRCKSIIYEQKNTDHEIFCDYIISTCDVITLYETIMPEEFIPIKTLNRLKDAELYSSALIVNAFLDCPAEKLGFGEEIIALNKNEIDIENKTTENNDIKLNQVSVFSQSARNNSLVPDGKGSLTILMPASFKSHEKWKTITDNIGNIVRGDAYKTLKTRYAEALIKLLNKKLTSSLKGHITYYDVITPITFWRYTKNHEGTMMGQKPGKKNTMLKVAKYRTPLKGLFIGGHWAELGGGVPIVVKTAYNSCLMVLKDKNHASFKTLAKMING